MTYPVYIATSNFKFKVGIKTQYTIVNLVKHLRNGKKKKRIKISFVDVETNVSLNSATILLFF